MKDGTFKIIYLDTTEFIGNLFNKDWKKVFDYKGIKVITFAFGNKIIQMENFREYNLTMEIYARMGFKQRLNNITLVGRTDDKSILIIFDMNLKKIIKKEIDKYTEYGNFLSSTWKKGTIFGIPKTYHT